MFIAPLLFSLTALTSAAAQSSSVPLEVTIFSPDSKTVAGTGGARWVIDFAVALKDQTVSYPAVAGTVPFVSSPVANNTLFKLGPDPVALGLVVLSNTTRSNGTGPQGTVYKGPLTNLAGVFQLNAITNTNPQGGILETWYDWYVGGPSFGFGVASKLTIYVMNETAPTYISAIPTAGDPGILSNIATVDFRVSDNSTNGALPTNPSSKAPEVTILAPSNGDRAGVNGSGWLVDLVIEDVGLSGALNSYRSAYQDATTNPSFGPGVNPAAPGLVVTCSTTQNTTGTPYHGPTTNLAALFQIVTKSLVNGKISIAAVWQLGKPVCGMGINSTITAYVVEGLAPLYVNASTQPLSNPMTVNFTIAGQSPSVSSSSAAGASGVANKSTSALPASSPASSGTLLSVPGMLIAAALIMLAL